MFTGVQVASLYAKISADSSAFRNEANKVKSELNVMQRGFNDFGAVAADLGRKAAVAVAALGVALTGVGVVIAKTGIEFNGMKEQALVAFTTMLGSGERAKAFLDDLQKFAAATPFEFPDLVRASQRLLAMGFAANEVKPLLTAVGDAVAALGGSSEMVDRVTLALGQMQAKGKVSAEEMLQLTEAGIPAWEILAKKIGVSIPEAMAMATKGAIRADTAIGALVEGMNTRFGGMMEQQSQTFNGLISTIKDNFAMLSGVVMEPFFVLMKSGLKSIATLTSDPAFVAGVQKFAAQLALWIERGIVVIRDVLPKLWDAVRQGVEVVQTIVGHILAFVDAVRLMLEPVIGVIGKVVSWKDALTALALILGTHIVIAIAGFIAALTPVIALVAAVTAAVAALRWAWTNDFLTIRTTTQTTLQKIQDAFRRYVGPLENLWRPVIVTMKNDTTVTMPWILQQVIGHLKWWWMDTKIAINQWIAGWKERFTDWKRDAIHIVETTFQETLWKIEDWWRDIKWQIDDFVNGWRVRLGEWNTVLTSHIDDALEVWETFRTKWLGWFKPSEWLQYGRDWIQGLWDGVAEKWNQFVNWWRDRWQNLKDGWNRFWQSHSPSEWFADAGRGWMEGLQGGIESKVGGVTGVIDKLNRDVQDGMIKTFEIFEDGSYRITQLSGTVTKGIIENGKRIMTGWEPAPSSGGSGSTAGNPNAPAPAGYKWGANGQLVLDTGSTAKATADTYIPKNRTFSQDMAVALASNLTTRVSDVHTWLDAFVNDFMGAVTAPGQAQFSGAGEAAIATQYVRNSEAVNVSAGKIIAQLGILIEELRSRGLGNQFNLSMAPTRTGDTTTDLRAVVEYLQLLYA